MTQVGILHPGQMGSSVGAAAVAAGHDVLWVSAGRSSHTRSRAADAGLRDGGTLGSMTAACDVIVSVCPPDKATALASEVAATGFGGLYVDANAVSPATAAEVRAIMSATEAVVVDGGIIGPPARAVGSTRMYVAGDGAAEIVELFDGSLLSVIALDSEYGSASALKMAYAGWTKGSSALLMTIAAYAASEGVAAALTDEWNISQPGVARRAEGSAMGTAPKAWRFVGEMHEIEASLAARGLPAGFHQAAADLYARMADFKDEPDATDLAAVIAAILNGQSPPAD